jgi:hypothetical protein
MLDGLGEKTETETETGEPIQSRTEDGADGGIRTLWRRTDGLPAAGRERNRASKRASQRERTRYDGARAEMLAREPLNRTHAGEDLDRTGGGCR